MIKGTGNRTCPKVITYHENKESLRMKTLKEQEKEIPRHVDGQWGSYGLNLLVSSIPGW